MVARAVSVVVLGDSAELWIMKTDPDVMHALVTRGRPRRPRLRRDQRRWAIGGAAVVVVAVLAVAAGTDGGNRASYRTASVERADVDATIASLGTIQPVNQATLSFPVGGTVSSVPATVGQHVTVGHTLARLETTSLDAQVASAQSAVATAQAKLAADQASQATPTVTAAVAPSALSTPATSGDDAHATGTGSPEPASAARDVLTKQQTQLINDQHRADQDLSQEKRDLTTETNSCQAFVSATNRSTTQVSANHTQRHGRLLPETATTATPPDPSQCQAAITVVLADQAAVDHDQQAMTADLPALSAAIAKLMTTAKVTHPEPSPHPPATSSTARSARTTAANQASTAVRPPATVPALRPASPQQLASDQAAIDAASAQLTEAQQAHDQAELRSPIDGTVGSVTISAGEAVPGGPGSPQIVVIGPGAHQVTYIDQRFQHRVCPDRRYRDCHPQRKFSNLAGPSCLDRPARRVRIHRLRSSQLPRHDWPDQHRSAAVRGAKRVGVHHAGPRVGHPYRAQFRGPSRNFRQHRYRIAQRHGEKRRRYPRCRWTHPFPGACRAQRR